MDFPDRPKSAWFTALLPVPLCPFGLLQIRARAAGHPLAGLDSPQRTTMRVMHKASRYLGRCLMARGRVITPDFWSDGNMVGVSAFARLLYIGTWNFAHCDKGHLDDDPMGLKLKILPADQVDPRALIQELAECGRIVRIRADNGKTFLFIPTFERYQKADPRWKTRCPACALINSGELTETPVSFGEHEQTPLISALREENQREENRREPERTEHARASVERLFDEAYEHWPKKVERKVALEKFRAATKRMPAEDLAAHIICFGDAYAETTDRQFTPALGVWLSHERWTDELPSPRADPNRKASPTERARATLALATDIDQLELNA